MNRVEVLLEFAKIENDEARRYEGQRERLLGLMFVATGAILAAIFSDSHIRQIDIVLAGLATALNFFVSVTSLSFYLAFKRRYERYRALRSEISLSIGNPSIEEIIRKADEIDSKKGRYTLIKSVKLHVIWTTLSWAVTLGSAAMLCYLFLHLAP